MLRSMNGLQAHFRNKFLAGIMAAVPIAVLIIAGIWIEEKTYDLAVRIGLPYHGLGIVLVIVAVYVLGILVTSVLGRFFLRFLDRVLTGIPGLKLLYQAWKDILVIGPGKKDMYSSVFLVPSPDGKGMQVGFTNGEALPNDPARMCVFLPNVPNPITGRVVIIERELCQPLNMPMEEAFKFLLSTGNYMPSGMATTQEKR
jgi:uncharacterized membrane protein